MQLKSILLIIGLALVISSAVFSQQMPAPEYAVIPVTIDTPLSSSTAMAGQTFYTHCTRASCGDFPTGTTFIGQVTSVIRASRKTPGQIGVRFIRAILPNGTAYNINGLLTSIHPNDVIIDPQTGTMTARSPDINNLSKFIAYGTGASLLIGTITRDNIATGAIIGADVGYQYGTIFNRRASARDVFVPAGTQFGVMLREPIEFQYNPGSGAGPGGVLCPPFCTGSGPVRLIQITFGNAKPFTVPNGSLMVPFQPVFQSIGLPFNYNDFNKTISITNPYGLQITQTLGTNIAHVNGQVVILSNYSSLINGVIYESSDFIGLATGKTVAWNSASGILTLQ